MQVCQAISGVALQSIQATSSSTQISKTRKTCKNSQVIVAEYSLKTLKIQRDSLDSRYPGHNAHGNPVNGRVINSEKCECSPIHALPRWKH